METKDFAGLCSIIILALGIVGISAADVPTRIHYQGVLSDASGPIDGDVNLTVELYAVTVPGGRAILVWSDTQVTAVANGVYSAWIEGTTTNPFPGGLFTNPEVYISVLAGSERILPLTELGTVPYAFRADTAADAETLDGHVPDDFIPAGTDDRVDESGDTMTGPLSVGGEVESTIDGFRFPDGSVQTTAASEANNIKGALDAMAELLGEPDFMKSFPAQTASLYTCTPDEAPRMTLEALGGPVGGVTGMIGWDGISHNFTYLLAVQSAFPDLLEDEYLRQDGTLTITGAISNARIRGVITGFGLAAWDGRTATYVAKFEPFLSFLDYTVDYRTHQNLSVSDIVRGVLQRYFPSSRYSFLLSERYDPLPFEIMYGERVGDYMRRLLEKAGIHYHFASDGDSVVISDTNTGFSTSGITLPYHGHLVRPEGGAFIGTLSRRKALYTGSATIRGYNFENSLALIEGTANSGGVGEYYEYDTRIAEEAYAITQAEIEQARLNVKAAAYYGTSNYAGLKAGHTINISGIGGAFSGEYLVKQVRHVILSEENGYCVQANAFRAIRSDVTYRPPRRVPVPRISGLVSARVTGPPGEEFYTDEYGRVRVQFIWDREGQMNDDSSAWLRVMTPPGKVRRRIIESQEYIPAVGQEVLVAFIQGDPSNPIVVGSAYNSQWMPPELLPDSLTEDKVTIMANGGPTSYVHIQGTDLNLVADRNLAVTVTNDAALDISGTATTIIGTDSTIEIGANASTVVGETSSTEVGGNASTTVLGSLGISSGAELSLTAGEDPAATVVNPVLELKASRGSARLEGATEARMTSPASAIIRGGAGTQVTSPAETIIEGSTIRLN